MIMLTLPWPPTVNTYWRAVSGRVLISAKGRAYREAVVWQKAREKWAAAAPGARLAVDIEAFMPDKRRRDLDNLPKAVLDSLTHAGVWEDDSQIDDLRVRRADDIAGMLRVRIREISR
jgi:crossover junction endodeoxyribonuclease RusA